MEDQHQPQTQSTDDQTKNLNPISPRTRTTQCSLERIHEPVRSRWTPKPEQILILESIFNSGMVNPPKDETVKIRKLLEKFGSVGDANVFYWFQNRRSRSRRRQRQIQASLISSGVGAGGCSSGEIKYQGAAAYTTTAPGFVLQQPSFFQTVAPPLAGSSSSSSSRPGGAGCSYSISGQAATFPKTENDASMSSSFQHLDTSKVHYEIASRVITVFINGVPTEVESGPLNMKAMFGQDLMLIHSSGVPVPLDEYGILVPGLQHGESYFLVSKGC